mmetsp:Transcript_16797/g.38893  ORF Transcript_16797/g.38893 Transcript_16797/m.38893 type:complete len:356 (+) Transcript_16797:203-1270(+)
MHPGLRLRPLLELLLKRDHGALEALGLERPHLEQRVLVGLEVEEVLLHVRAHLFHDRCEAQKAPGLEPAAEGRVVVLAVELGLLLRLEHLEHAHVPVLALELVEAEGGELAVVEVAEVGELVSAEHGERVGELLELEREQPRLERRGRIAGVVVEVKVAGELHELVVGLLPAAGLEKLHVQGVGVAVGQVDHVLLHVATEVEEALLQALEAPAFEPEVERGGGLVEVDGLKVLGVGDGLLPVLLLNRLETDLRDLLLLEEVKISRGHHIEGLKHLEKLIDAPKLEPRAERGGVVAHGDRDDESLLLDLARPPRDGLPVGPVEAVPQERERRRLGDRIRQGLERARCRRPGTHLRF